MLYRTAVLDESGCDDISEVVQEKKQIVHFFMNSDVDVIYSKWDEHGQPGDGPVELKIGNNNTGTGSVSWEIEMAPDYNGWKRKKDSLSM